MIPSGRFLEACNSGELLQLVEMERKVDLVGAKFGRTHSQSSRANALMCQAYGRLGSRYFRDRAQIAWAKHDRCSSISGQIHTEAPTKGPHASWGVPAGAGA